MPFITIPEPLAAIGDFTGLPAAHLVGAPVPLTEVSLGILLTGALALFRSVEAPDMVRDMALDLMRTALEAEIENRPAPPTESSIPPSPPLSPTLSSAEWETLSPTSVEDWDGCLQPLGEAWGTQADSPHGFWRGYPHHAAGPRPFYHLAPGMRDASPAFAFDGLSESASASASSVLELALGAPIPTHTLDPTLDPTHPDFDPALNGFPAPAIPFRYTPTSARSDSLIFPYLPPMTPQVPPPARGESDRDSGRASSQAHSRSSLPELLPPFVPRPPARMGFALLASAPAPQFPPAQLLTDADGNTFRFYLLGSPALSAASASSTSALSASAPVPASADDAGIADVLVALHQLQTSVDELKACVGVRLANGAEVMYEEVEGESLWSWSPVESRAASPSSAPAP